MNEQQRAYSKQQIENYKQEVSELYYKINRNGVFAFCGLGLSIAIFAIDGEFTPYETLDNLIGVLSGASVVINGISAIKRTCEREALSQRIREIEYDLKMDELNEDKPKVYQKTNTDKK